MLSLSPVLDQLRSEQQMTALVSPDAILEKARQILKDREALSSRMQVCCPASICAVCGSNLVPHTLDRYIQCSNLECFSIYSCKSTTYNDHTRTWNRVWELRPNADVERELADVTAAIEGNRKIVKFWKIVGVVFVILIVVKIFI